MKQIPLYDVQNLAPPSSITREHWRPMAERAESELRRFLELDAANGILLLDRATRGLELALGSSFQTVYIPNRTYRAAANVARGRIVFLNAAQPPPAAGDLVVPTTLGGTAPVHLHSPHPFVYDCAHTCYKGMFRGKRFTDRQYAVLSFYPTKPMGAFGGGALVGALDTIESARAVAWPVEDTPSRFYYPQTVQSWGVLCRLAEYDESVWRDRRAQWTRVADWVLEHYPVRLAWGGPIETPHLLAFMGRDRGDDIAELREHCVAAGLETGNHYPTQSDAVWEHITVPWHTDEVIERLKEVR